MLGKYKHMLESKGKLLIDQENSEPHERAALAAKLTSAGFTSNPVNTIPSKNILVGEPIPPSNGVPLSNEKIWLVND